MMASQHLLLRFAVLSFALAAALAGCSHRAISNKPLISEPKPATASEQATLSGVNVGMDLFVARCGSCHNERGDKPLRSGLPLNQRKLSREVIAEAVQDRLKDKTEAERKAVIEYISGLYVGEGKQSQP